jgi:flagellar basal body-associated protein FliL
MKRGILFALIACITLSLHVDAQKQKKQSQNGTEAPAKRYQYSPGERADRLAKQLNLENAQKMELELYFMNVDERQKELREKLKNVKDPEKRKAMLEAERNSNESELRVILGSEKMIKYIEMRENREYRNRNNKEQ